MIGRAISKGTDITAEWLSKIIDAYPDVNAEWLLTGVGEIFAMKSTESAYNQNVGGVVGEDVGKRKVQETPTKKLRTKSIENVPEQKGDNFGDISGDKRKVQKTSPFDERKYSLASDEKARYITSNNVFSRRTDRLIERQQIPVYDMDAVAGLVPLFADSYNNQQVVEVLETSLIPKCDGGLRIVGDSMYPLLKSGDVVFYKQIHDIAHNLVWGEMYLISFDIEGEEYVTVKYIKRSPEKDHVTLVSHNEHHSPMDIHIGRIRALAFIKASLRLNSIK